MLFFRFNFNWKVDYLGKIVKMVSIDYEPKKLHELYLHTPGTIKICPLTPSDACDRSQEVQCEA